ncbi:hypothetical protein KJ997_00580, partial [bacterium]|nr:hypothetical protein [bacterium]
IMSLEEKMFSCLKCGFFKLVTTYVGQCLAKNTLIWKKKFSQERWCEDYMPRLEWMLPEEHKKLQQVLKDRQEKPEDLLNLNFLNEKSKEIKKIYNLPLLGKISSVKVIEGVLKAVLLIAVCVLVATIIISTIICP